LAETGNGDNNMHYIYVLWSSKLNKRYVGSTEEVGKRFDEHNRGCNKFTKGGIPWLVIYQEKFSTKTEALKREKFLKSGQGRAWLDKQLPIIRRDAGVV
jgi:putative endonuclease